MCVPVYIYVCTNCIVEKEFVLEWEEICVGMGRNLCWNVVCRQSSFVLAHLWLEPFHVRVRIYVVALKTRDPYRGLAIQGLPKPLALLSRQPRP